MSLVGKRVYFHVYNANKGKAIAVIIIALQDLKIFFNLSSTSKTFLSLFSLLSWHSLV